MTGEKRRRWVVLTPRRRDLDLSGPVEGEVRRDPISDADVPCPRCGARKWLLVERRAEPEQPFTRWRAFACGNCGAADGWHAAGRTRPGRAAEGVGPWLADIDWTLSEVSTVGDVARLASFPVFAPGPGAVVRQLSEAAGTLAGVTLAAGDLEVTTEVRHRIARGLRLDPPAEDRARIHLELKLDHRPEELRTRRSAPAQEIHATAARARAEARARAAPCRETRVEIDGTAVVFALVEAEGCWAAVADHDEVTITILGRDVPASHVSLQRVTSD